MYLSIQLLYTRCSSNKAQIVEDMFTMVKGEGGGKEEEKLCTNDTLLLSELLLSSTQYLSVFNPSFPQPTFPPSSGYFPPHLPLLIQETLGSCYPIPPCIFFIAIY